MLEPGKRREQASEKNKNAESRRHRLACFATVRRDHQPGGQREHQGQHQGQQRPRKFAAANPAHQEGQAQDGKNGEYPINRLNGGGRQLAQRDIEAAQVREKQHAQCSFALFHAETVCGQKNAREQAEPESGDGFRDKDHLADLMRRCG